LFFGILAAGLLWRLLLAFVLVPMWEARTGVASAPDAYPLLARSLVTEGTLGYAPVGASPTTVRGPGFPAWLAVSVAAGADNPRWLGLWGGLPGLLAGAWLASLLARRWCAIAGIVGGAVAVLHPLPSLIASRVMGDDFYGALGFAALALWTNALGSEDRRRGAVGAVAAGLLLAVQMLARASGLLTLFVAIVYMLWRGRGKFVLGVILAAVALLPPLGWSIRTSRLEDRPVFVHSLGAYNFWIGEGFDRFGTGKPPSGNYPRIVRFALSQAGPEFEDERFWYAGLEPLRAAELDARLAHAARQRIADDPLGYARRVLEGIPAFWVRAMTTSRTLQYAVAVVPVLLLAALGIRSVLRDPLGVQLLLVLAAHNLAYAAVFPAARMSVQVYPALAYLAGAGAAASLRRLGRAVHRP
jgi:hypothetical protein